MGAIISDTNLSRPTPVFELDRITAAANLRRLLADRSRLGLSLVPNAIRDGHCSFLFFNIAISRARARSASSAFSADGAVVSIPNLERRAFASAAPADDVGCFSLLRAVTQASRLG